MYNPTNSDGFYAIALRNDNKTLATIHMGVGWGVGEMGWGLLSK
jgi:hypothetical protein